jgi:hypothetical protein
VNNGGELIVTNSSLSNITTSYNAAIVSAVDAQVRFTDTIMLNNHVQGGIDIEGGLITVSRSDLTLDRVHITGTVLSDSQSIQGGVIRVDNAPTSRLFQMQDSSIHGTSFDYTDNVEGGVMYLGNTNAFIIGNSFGPLTSPFSDFRVQGALLFLNNVQASILNNAMWTDHELPVDTIRQQNLTWGPLCGPATLGDTRDGPIDYIALSTTPFVAPAGIRLLLKADSPCVNAGNTNTADSFNIWWPSRVSQVGTTRDISPVDLGAHYNP